MIKIFGHYTLAHNLKAKVTIISLSVLLLGGIVLYVKHVRSRNKFEKVFKVVPVTLGTGSSKATSLSSLIVQKISVTPYDTSYVDLAVTKWKLPFHDAGVSGPVVALDRHNFLFISKCGEFIGVELANNDLSISKTTPGIAGDEVYCDGPVTGLKGALLRSNGSSLLLSYHHLVTPNCVSMRIVESEFDRKTFALSKSKLIFESDPCNPADITVYTQAGGIMTENSNSGEIHFSSGDFGRTDYPQNVKVSYGGFWTYDPKTQKTKRQAIGSRNSQGIDYDPVAKILWASEHGPRGGDEVNTVGKGENFGWPVSSYGLDYTYAADGLKYKGLYGNHDFGKKPVFVFLPSIGVSSLKVYPRDSYFSDWGGDLIVASLRGKTIYRLKTEDRKIIYAEPLMNLEERLRTLVVQEDGALFATADPDLFFQIQKIDAVPIDEIKYGQVSSSECVHCHSGERSATAPNLFSRPVHEIIEALEKFASGTRRNPRMQVLAQSLSKTKRAALAKYFSSSRSPSENH